MKKLLALACVACAHGSAGNLSNHGGGANVPAGPTPVVKAEDLKAENIDSAQFDAENLPAIATDRSRVVYGEIDDDGERGYANYAVAWRDLGDREVRRKSILTVDEVDKVTDDQAARAKLVATVQQRIWDANADLAKTGWIPLEPMSPTDAAESGDGDFSEVGIDGAKIRFAEPKVTITVHDKKVFDQDLKGWSAPHTECPQGDDCDACNPPAHVESAWTDADRRVFLIQVRYTGSDTCDVSPTYHVISVR